MASYNRKMNSRNRRKRLWVLIAVLAVLLIAALILVLCLTGKDPQDVPSVPSQNQTHQIEATVAVDVPLGNGLTVDQVGSYTGVYMEDGSDAFVEDVLMLVVTNNSRADLQYAEITLPVSDGEAQFSLSTLPAGQSAVVLEKNRMTWSKKESYAEATVKNTVQFNEPLSLCEDSLKLQILNGGMNVTNISNNDITGDIVIYYKNVVDGMYYGGITYRVRLEGGLKANGIQQIMSDHFSADGSRVMFITIE